MKRILLLFIVAVFATTANAQWQTNGPDSTVVECLAVSGTSVFAGTAHKGIFLSTDNGGSWAAVNTGLPYTTFNYVSSMVVSASNVFAATVGGGIFLSTNNGSNWATASTGLTTNTVFSLAVSGSTIYASTNSGVFISSNNGGNWSLANTGITGNVGSFAVGNGTIFAATSTTVYSSTNNGNNWTAAGDTELNFTPIYSLVATGSQLYAGTYSGGVFLSDDNGNNWEQELTYLPLVGYMSSIVIYNDTNIFAADYGAGVYFITTNDIDSDFGGWAPAGDGLQNVGVSSLAVSGNYLFAGTGGGGVWQLYLPSIIFDGIPEISASVNADFNLYPNPSSVGSVQCAVGPAMLRDFASLNNGQGCKLDVYDITGQLILSQAIENSKTTVDVSALAAGMYMVSVKSKSGIATKKLVIQAP